ncbi:hypothetical protein BRADI_2g25883v3 [Brachypodium distachyon]|uniref:Uncharacterized protein n=1 Tax=Brachypodium distachyon TaxID=15368 RepID=A0A2K2DAI3_BRADI|nr:hypothetical protein BRADI_2g25883v3 [Brachypodium distachyon]
MWSSGLQIKECRNKTPSCLPIQQCIHWHEYDKCTGIKRRRIYVLTFINGKPAIIKLSQPQYMPIRNICAKDYFMRPTWGTSGNPAGKNRDRSH